MQSIPCQAVSEVFDALAHPVRVRIVELLMERELCVCEIVALLGRRQAYVSQQLAVLRQAGIVHDRREGLKVFYRLADDRIGELVRRAAALSGCTDAAAVA